MELTPMGSRRRTVWVVMHYEIMGLPSYPRVDSVQFHVASTLAKAEEYVLQVETEPYSWWQVHPHVVDTDEGGEGSEAWYYSHRGTRLKSAPVKRAISAFRRHAARHPELWPSDDPKS